ncbi:MAG TPA: hypothetical protein VFZ61_22635, partial [Polyangiales bacterium]
MTLTNSGCVLEWERDQKDAGRPSGARDAALNTDDRDPPLADAGQGPRPFDSGAEQGADAQSAPDASATHPQPAGSEAGAAANACARRCGAGEQCDPTTGRCECQPGWYLEAGRCTLDPCAQNTCATHELCTPTQGVAICRCAPGTTACGDSGCLDLQHDPAHCGRCDLACADQAPCRQGQCGRLHQLNLAHDSSCALLAPKGEGYTLRCWGDPRYALFRDDSVAAVTAPRAIQGFPAARMLAANQHYRCVLGAKEDR